MHHFRCYEDVFSEMPSLHVHDNELPSLNITFGQAETLAFIQGCFLFLSYFTIMLYECRERVNKSTNPPGVHVKLDVT